jgi:hypothetical protein
MVDLAKLKELLHYDPDTGLFTWLVSRGRHARPGSQAGTIHKVKRSHASYLRIKIDGKSYLAHRLAFLYMTGEWPTGQPDHRNTDGLDNSWENLRDSSQSQNQANRPARKDNRSGIKGVSYCDRDQLYHAEIQCDGQRIGLGYFKEAGPAALAYAKAAKELFGEFARIA